MSLSLEQFRECLYLTITEYHMDHPSYRINFIPVAELINKEQRDQIKTIMDNRKEEIYKLYTQDKGYFIPNLTKYSKSVEKSALEDLRFIGTKYSLFWKALVELSKEEYDVIDENGNFAFYDPRALYEKVSTQPNLTIEEIKAFRSSIFKSKGFDYIKVKSAFVDFAVVVNKYMTCHAVKYLGKYYNVSKEPKKTHTIVNYTLPDNALVTSPKLLSFWHLKISNALAILPYQDQIQILKKTVLVMDSLFGKMSIILTYLFSFIRVATIAQLYGLIDILNAENTNNPINIDICATTYKAELLKRGTKKVGDILTSLYYEMAHRRYQPHGVGYEEAKEEFQRLATIQ